MPPPPPPSRPPIIHRFFFSDRELSRGLLRSEILDARGVFVLEILFFQDIAGGGECFFSFEGLFFWECARSNIQWVENLPDKLGACIPGIRSDRVRGGDFIIIARKPTYEPQDNEVTSVARAEIITLHDRPAILLTAVR